MQQKRGQITIYVILGIVILIVLGIVIYYTQQPATEGIIKSTTLPSQFAQVEAHIQGCLEQTTREGIAVVSQQGGYLTLEDPTPLSIVNEFSTSLATIPGGSATAYWYYEQSNRVPVNKEPTKQTLQKELEQYIDTHLTNCLDYHTFETIGYRFTTANPVSTVSIADTNVKATLHYPVTIYYKATTNQLTTTTITIPTALGTLFATAKNFFDVTNQQLYFENKTLDFITIYDQLPSSGVDFNCAPKTWTKTEVRNDFKTVLEKNLPFLKPVSNTHDFKDPFLVNTAVATPKNVQIDIQYNPAWPLQLNFIGRDTDEVLTGEPFTTNNKLTGILTPIFCLNQYHFVYTVKYPLLVTVRKGDEYFQYAYQVVIDHNQPRTATIQPEDHAIILNENSPLCTAGSQALTISTLANDAAGNYRALPGTSVALQCVDALCNLGTSNARGELNVQTPACINGQLRGHKQGYQTGTATLTTTEPGSISIVLDKTYTPTVDTLIMDNGERTLQTGEQAFITLSRSDASGSTMIIQPGTTTVDLTAGTYYVRSYLLTNNPGGITIADRIVKACVDVPKKGILGVLGVTEKNCLDKTVKGTTIDQAISGGNDYDFTITEDDLQNNNHITFFIPYYGTPRTYDALTKVNEKITKSKAIPPRWSNE